MRLPRLPIWIKAALIAVAAVFIVHTFVVSICEVPYDGMETSICKGEKVLVNRWSYGLRLPFSTQRIAEQKASRGDIILFNNPNPSNPFISVWKRGTLIGRCSGIPGDTLMLDKELLVTNQKSISPSVRMLYSYPQSAEDTILSVIKHSGIKGNRLAGYRKDSYIRSFTPLEYYKIRRLLPDDFRLEPLNHSKGIDSVHPFVIPSKGAVVNVLPWNITLLCNTILHHENKVACIRNDSLIVEGEYVKSYKFQNDYYWITSNNPLSICDSRLFGFVPQSHLIGKAEYVVMSPYRERFLKKVE